jgi:hypothetical protein
MAATYDGEAINQTLLQAGVIALTRFDGSRIEFYPRGALPPYVFAHLTADDNARLFALRNYLINLARGIRPYPGERERGAGI